MSWSVWDDFQTCCFKFDRNLPRRSCQASGCCLFSLLRQLLVEQSCISAFSDVPLVSFVLQTRHSLYSRLLLSFSHFMHIYIIYVWQCWMCCPLCFSGDGQGPLLSFLALVFLILPKKYIFSPIGTSILYQPSFGMQVLLVLTNKVRLSVKCILAIPISCAASHWCWGLLAPCRAA